MASTTFSGPVTSDNGFIGNITGNVTGSISGGITSGASATEINVRTDDSAMIDTRADAGAISVTTAYTALTTTGVAAITLAVPTKPAFIKVIKMTAYVGDATLALTNVVGGSAATTATFNAIGETLVLVSDVASGKWIVIAEVGVTLT